MAHSTSAISYAPPPRSGVAGLQRPQAAGSVAAAQEHIPQEGQRRLVRPQMPQHMAQPALAPRRLRGSRPLAAQPAASAQARQREAAAGNAEALFFQKQIQMQTPMVFVMEDGEHLYGIVEWYDRETIKIRGHSRALVYKRAIKYLYKANDHSGD